jgi:hypothetical protein
MQRKKNIGKRKGEKYVSLVVAKAHGQTRGNKEGKNKMRSSYSERGVKL